MSEWLERKRAFYRDVARHAVTELSELTRIYPLGWDLADVQLEAWLRKFQTVPEIGEKFPTMPRLLNHFTTGADPEFIFINTSNGLRVNAESLHMQAGRAYGADNNGRLAEIRPFPDKSQLKVLASVHSTLRWLLVTVPQTQTLGMVCGAFLQADGLGGHVHVGRKQAKSRATEVRGLDALAHNLEQIGVFPKGECETRRHGDQFNQRYGLPGDVRPQAHGYEYRTFPSWLDSPWLAYFTLVMSKLAVYDPEIFEARTKNLGKHLEFILRYYRGLDDDALLALHVLLKKGIPKHIGGDFRERWGLTGYTDKHIQKGVLYIPSAIPPHDEDVQALWEHFALDKPLPSTSIPKVTWEPSAPPRGYKCVLDLLQTRGAKGLGEMFADIVCREEEINNILPYATRNILNEEGKRCPLLIGRRMLKYLPLDWRTKLPKGSWALADAYGIGISAEFREGAEAKYTKKLLLSGAFPLWRIQDAGPEAEKAWKERFPDKKTPTEVAGLIGRIEQVA